MTSRSELAVGAALGGLVGLLLGLSISDVVGSALSAILVLLGAAFGLGAAEGGPLRSGRPGRIIGFGCACAAGVVGGVWLRAHSALGPDASAQMETWRDLGASDALALDLVIYQRLGLTPGTLQPAGDGVAARAGASALFSTDAAAACARLDNPIYQEAEALRVAMQDEGGLWAELARREPGDDAAALHALFARVRAICQ